MSDIKIFVSHRIDINSELVDNPIYVPVRCGAVYDKQNYMNIQGDNTGDNISEKRMTFCEFTVQYWAWKNVQADYYGLCHYRRYLSFSEKRYKTNEYQMVHVPILLPKDKEKYGLLDKDNIEKIVNNYDIIVSEYTDVKKIQTPIGRVETLKKQWEAFDNVFFEKSTINLMFDLIDKMFPEYSNSAKEYLEGNKHRGYNCYILKKELFNRLCEFQFPILFEIEKQIDTTGYDQTMKRTPGFIGEMLYGIFIYHITTYESWKVKELQLVYFLDTKKIENVRDLYKRKIWSMFDRTLRSIVDPLMPIGSIQRENAKKILFCFFKNKQKGIANIKE